ncbi:MAG: SDR family NAD(P)-dependent oxidoreductase [Prolixibacteraceae bacterium]|nr:SDR family NAD(P)-dependent oxidoreductase [Prolixibacteraceae bacterium]MBN2774289.1 SDR family NAD(P)-dependent oxidoreductase [Prolixibacteraceae bacterium]
MKAIKYTIITGAAKGLGRAFATECARLGMNLILTALPGENIEVFARKLETGFRTKNHYYETDLTKPGSVEELATWISNSFCVNMLINNAGVGGTKAFLNVSTEYIDQIVLLNMRALVVLTRLLLPELRKNPRAYILNIASMASFGPMPYKTVYPASKAFVYSFSRGLSTELRETGIIVSVAHPGGMKTNPEVTRRIENHGRLIQSTTLPVEKVAKICIRKLMMGKKLIIPGTMNKLSWLLMKIIPVQLRLLLMKNSLKNELEIENSIINQNPVCNESIG